MKKALKIFTAALCLVVMSFALTACSLFFKPKVAGCTYKYDMTDCDTSGLDAVERMAINNKLLAYRSEVHSLAFSEEGTVEITSLFGEKSTYEYLQLGSDVVIPDGPNENTQYQGDMVLGFSVTGDSNEVLKWHILFITGANVSVDVDIYYSIVPEIPTE